MTLSITAQLGWAASALFVGMAMLWRLQKSIGDAGIVDVAWTFNLGLLAAYYWATSSTAADEVGDWQSPRLRAASVALLAILWSTRLAGYILVNRVLGKVEDGRYRSLRQNWGDRAQPFFFVFFQVQGLLDLVFSISFLIPIRFAGGPFGWLDVMGLAIGLFAIVGETIADAQLARFRGEPTNRGKTCRVGLWQCSRHPNYFFEWLHWWSYVLLGWTAGGWWWGTLLAPALMLYFLFKVTGIPATEAQALRSRTDYADYQRTTSAFVPWFPRSGR